jgi:hypothetical protein
MFTESLHSNGSIRHNIFHFVWYIRLYDSVNELTCPNISPSVILPSPYTPGLIGFQVVLYFFGNVGNIKLFVSRLICLAGIQDPYKTVKSGPVSDHLQIISIFLQIRPLLLWQLKRLNVRIVLTQFTVFRTGSYEFQRHLKTTHLHERLY